MMSGGAYSVTGVPSGISSSFESPMSTCPENQLPRARLWRSLEQWMQAQGLGTCARQLVKQLATIKSMDVVLPVRRAAVTTQLRLRAVATPEPVTYHRIEPTAQLLAHLGLRLPKGTRCVANVVPKNVS